MSQRGAQLKNRGNASTAKRNKESSRKFVYNEANTSYLKQHSAVSTELTTTKLYPYTWEITVTRDTFHGAKISKL
jgi:hypothetical protein